MGYLGVGLWLFYNLVYNYVMANIVGPGTSSDIPPQLLHHHQVLKKCKKCRNPKPIRTHHCSICDKCILQMDRKWICNVDHCPWMGVCIGHNNRRYFIRFLLYLDLACFLVVGLVVREHLPSKLYGYFRGWGVYVYVDYWDYYWGVWVIPLVDSSPRPYYTIILRNTRWVQAQQQCTYKLHHCFRYYQYCTCIITHLYPTRLQRLRMGSTIN